MADKTDQVPDESRDLGGGGRSLARPLLQLFSPPQEFPSTNVNILK